MSDFLIKLLDDYTIRELQIYSSKILSAHNATSSFIKQFQSEHDSVQFYKNVIFWYITKYNSFPDDDICTNQMK